MNEHNGAPAHTGLPDAGSASPQASSRTSAPRSRNSFLHFRAFTRTSLGMMTAGVGTILFAIVVTTVADLSSESIRDYLRGENPSPQQPDPSQENGAASSAAPATADNREQETKDTGSPLPPRKPPQSRESARVRAPAGQSDITTADDDAAGISPRTAKSNANQVANEASAEALPSTDPAPVESKTAVLSPDHVLSPPAGLASVPEPDDSKRLEPTPPEAVSLPKIQETSPTETRPVNIEEPAKTKSVFARESFALCGHRGFVADIRRVDVLLTNQNRDFIHQTGFLPWEKKVLLERPLEVFPGCIAAFERQSNFGAVVLLVREFSTTARK